MKKTPFTFYCCLIGMLGSGAATSDSFDYNPGFIRSLLREMVLTSPTSAKATATPMQDLV
jgi:hypothetical protein